MFLVRSAGGIDGEVRFKRLEAEKQFAVQRLPQLFNGVPVNFLRGCQRLLVQPADVITANVRADGISARASNTGGPKLFFLPKLLRLGAQQSNRLGREKVI